MSSVIVSISDHHEIFVVIYEKIQALEGRRIV